MYASKNVRLELEGLTASGFNIIIMVGFLVDDNKGSGGAKSNLFVPAVTRRAATPLIRTQ